jgi:hypothetical protein
VTLQLHCAPTERSTRLLHIVLDLSVDGSANNSFCRLLSSFSRTIFIYRSLFKLIV